MSYSIEEEKSRRGFCPTPYLDPSGKMLIGYATPAKPGEMAISREEAESLLKEEIEITRGGTK
jgi:hypothetical protein